MGLTDLLVSLSLPAALAAGFALLRGLAPHLVHWDTERRRINLVRDIVNRSTGSPSINLDLTQVLRPPPPPAPSRSKSRKSSHRRAGAVTNLLPSRRPSDDPL